MKRLGAVALLLASIACGDAGGKLRVRDAWAWPTVSGPTAGYLTIVNGGAGSDRLVGAESRCCASIEIHRTEVRGDRMSMTPAADGLPVGAGATVTLEPGGHHLMLFDPVEPLRVGSRFTLTLVFENAGELAVEVEVRR